MQVVTSGQEHRSAKPFFSGGKMRTRERTPWWLTFDDPVLVVFGHYWRRRMDAVDRTVDMQPSGSDIFDGLGPSQMLGIRRRAMCVDFAVGVRYEERGLGAAEGSLGTALGALRLPEQSLHWSDGRVEHSIGG